MTRSTNHLSSEEIHGKEGRLKNSIWEMTNMYANHHSSFIASQEGGAASFFYFSGRFVKDSFYWVQILLLGVCLAYPFICDVCPPLSWSLSVCWWTVVSSLMLSLGPWISLTKIRKILQGTVAHRACCSLTGISLFFPRGANM